MSAQMPPMGDSPHLNADIKNLSAKAGIKIDKFVTNLGKTNKFILVIL